MFSSIFDFFTSLRTVHTYGPLSESGSDIPGSELEAVEQLLAQKWVDDPLYKGWDASVSVNGRTTTCLEAYLGIMAETASKSGCVVTVKSLFGDMLAAGLIMTPKGIRDMNNPVTNAIAKAMRGNTDPSEDCEVSADVQQDENGEIQDDVDDLPYSMPKAAPEALMIATLAPLPTENQSRCAAIIDRAKEIASKHSRDLIGQNYDPTIDWARYGFEVGPPESFDDVCDGTMKCRSLVRWRSGGSA